jgi:hypothetical protein
MGEHANLGSVEAPSSVEKGCFRPNNKVCNLSEHECLFETEVGVSGVPDPLMLE